MKDAVASTRPRTETTPPSRGSFPHLNRLDFQTKVDGRRGMCERADTDRIDPRLGDGRDCIQRDPARSLAPAAVLPHQSGGLSKGLELHVVEQDLIGAGVQPLLDLFKCVALHLDAGSGLLRSLDG